jgi:hypothetical protein
MGKFIVKVLRVQGINNKTYVAGETVYDYNFPEGNAQKLVAEGKLTPLDTDKKAKKQPEKAEKAEKEAEKQPEKAEKEKAN